MRGKKIVLNCITDIIKLKLIKRLSHKWINHIMNCFSLILSC